MLYPADMHLHSTFSIDSSCSMEDHIQDAISKNFAFICFTEHYDLNPCDEGVGFYEAAARNEAYKRLKEKFGHQITLLMGLEFSEPHLYPHEFEKCMKKDYDYILGSIHFVGEAFILDKGRLAAVNHERMAEAYYKETLSAVTFGGFDALAHMDYLRRGTGLDLYNKDLLSDIFSAMVRNGIALEINTQNLRRGISEPFPTSVKAKAFRDAGGSRIVFGADGHHYGDLGSGIEEAIGVYSTIAGLTPGIYRNRKWIPV